MAKVSMKNREFKREKNRCEVRSEARRTQGDYQEPEYQR